jgi:hypothetical protein
MADFWNLNDALAVAFHLDVAAHSDNFLVTYLVHHLLAQLHFFKLKLKPLLDMDVLKLETVAKYVVLRLKVALLRQQSFQNLFTLFYKFDIFFRKGINQPLRYNLIKIVGIE